MTLSMVGSGSVVQNEPTDVTGRLIKGPNRRTGDNLFGLSEDFCFGVETG